MKTIKSFFGIATAFFALLQISCTKENATQEIIPEGFLEDKEYIIYYEASTNIIVGVESKP